MVPPVRWDHQVLEGRLVLLVQPVLLDQPVHWGHPVPLRLEDHQGLEGHLVRLVQERH